MNEGRALDDNGVLVCQRLAAAFNLVTCATVLRDEGVPDTLPTIGIEVEVPFSSYFPGLWRSYGLDRRPLRDMEAHELHAFSTECAAAEVTLRRRLALTVECGVPRGADRYWEFSFAPVRSVGLLVEQVRLLTEAGVLPRDRRHSLHVTIGGLRASPKAYALLGVLEVLYVEPQRIAEGLAKARSTIHSGWARKGRSGLMEKTASDLVGAAERGVELRTLQLPQEQGELAQLLELTQGCAHAIAVGDASPWATRWRLMQEGFRAQLEVHALPNVNWWTSSPAGGVDFDAWGRFVAAVPAIRERLRDPGAVPLEGAQETPAHAPRFG